MKRVTTHHPTLKAWRKSLGLNQRDAARLLQVPQPTYARMEVGGRPRPTVGKYVADKTGVPFEAVMWVA